ncbi:erythromycin esterase family protein [Streptomyces sp. NPDC051162]|uniref:erythromycin esterase family protein n=1 Tax=Streptomyces sp. NPDC051162 TaxID=3154747 RepID=UPI003441AFD6
MVSAQLTRRSALSLTLFAALGPLVAAKPAGAYSGPADPVSALTRAARPLRTTDPTGDLRDLRPLGAMVGDATVVGLGEATHGSHEFFANKHRVFRYLVEEKGFTTFALEANWSAGVRLDDYVVHGRGDARQIMAEEFQNAYRMWNNREYLDLIEWMRAYNTTHAKKLRFMGDDSAYAGPGLFDKVTGYVRAHRPALLSRFTELYRAQRPAPGTSTDSYMNAYLKRPLSERRAMTESAREALGLLSRQRPAGGGEEFMWAVQHARAISQVAEMYTFDLNDPKSVADCMRFRDATMAANTAWWQEHTGRKILLSAHNAHVTYVTDDPAQYPRVQGAFLRDRLGDRYVNVRLTFNEGSFLAMRDGESPRVADVGPAAPGSNEHTLDKVPYRDYVLDMRTAPAAARKWLAVARPTRNIGTDYPTPDYLTALGKGYDILIHLHRIRAADLLPHR